MSPEGTTRCQPRPTAWVEPQHIKPKRKRESQTDGILAGVEAALRRAQQRAREIAARTGTPLVIFRNGKIEKRMVTRGKKSKSE